MTAKPTLTPENAYDLICSIAREHALVWQASGGVVVIVHPETQRAEGIYEAVQEVHQLAKRPRSAD